MDDFYTAFAERFLYVGFGVLALLLIGVGSIVVSNIVRLQRHRRQR